MAAKRHSDVLLPVDNAMTAADRAKVRMGYAAQELFEKVLRRRNWIATDRDAVALWLDDLVRKEIRQRGPKR